MKKIFSILSLSVLLTLGAIQNAQSQVLLSLLFGDKLNSDGIEFGLEGGWNFSSINNLEADKRFSQFNLGFYFDIRLKNQWNIYTGVLVKSSLGDDELTLNDLEALGIPLQEEAGTYTQRINYFLVPALLKYNFPSRLYLEAGPQFGLRSKGWVEFNADNDDREIRVKEFNDDDMNRIEAGGVIGFGYKIRKDGGMTIGIKYYQGFTNVYKGVSGSTNNSWFIKANIPIGGNKKKSKKSDEAEIEADKE